ncbi:heterokaryon incompatibility (het-6OR allele) [Fusarium mundagurra]|uniref:Heterokaryon incompatibility (Het-6OR allele) n=1 Tax=Fusarium mundagurra TaxID=1567541 RepID=A0A8H5Y8T6_9HYPO|nr:heterokaryon incompatibility (het-6OR allele) [Fusarium mundagurra]
MALSSVYASLPLDRPRKDIRLLEILETSPQLRCKLSTASLLSSPKFCALSYVWGSSKDYQDIIVNDVSFLITKSLADALSNVPIHWSEAFPYRDKTDMRVWADALCINQDDNTEKGHQVPLIKDIYSSAQITFSCLASISPTSNIPAAIDYISEISARLDQNHPDTGPEAAVRILEDLPHRRVYPSAVIGNEILIRRNRQFDDSAICIIEDFNSLPYWDRAWIVQELILSKEVILYYAAHSINFRTLARVTYWASNLEKSVLSMDLSPAQHWLFKSLRFETLRGVDIFRRDQSDQGRMSSPALGFVGIWGTSFRATNPKDHVYAFLGILNLNIEPRYNESISVAEVYIEFCTTQLLISNQHSLGPLHFLRHAGLTNGNPGKLGLPTWVPNFPVCADGTGGSKISSLPQPMREQKQWKDSIGRVEDISIRVRSLFTTCLRIDCISHISPILDESHDSANFLQSVYKMLNDALQTSEHPYHKNSHPFLKLASAFCHARIPNLSWSALELLRVARMFLYLHLITSEENSIYREKFKDFPKNICCDLDHCMEMGDPEDKANIWSFMMDLITARGLQEDSIHGVWEVLHRFASKGTRVAYTAGNEFAIVSPEALIGDDIVLLTGCHDLSVIRKVGDYHVYVGPVGFAHEIVDMRIDEQKASQGQLQPLELQ